jgi:hypothetical protein
MNDRQMFVWAPELKCDLAALAQIYSAHPDIETEGLMRVANHPPLDDDFLVARIYDRLRPRWREQAAEPLPPITKIAPKIREQVDKLKNAPAAIGTASQEARPDAFLLGREIPIRRGRLRFAPAGIGRQPSEVEP